MGWAVWVPDLTQRLSAPARKLAGNRAPLLGYALASGGLAAQQHSELSPGLQGSLGDRTDGDQGRLR